MASTIVPLPIRRPSRMRGIRCGVLLIDSMPPATTMSVSPAAMPCAASITAFRPEPHTLLIVIAATCSCRPPWSAAWRAGFCPSPAATTLPMMHSSTAAGSMPARRTASRTAIAPSCGAVKSFRDPRNLPVAVRAAATMTASRIDMETFDGVAAEQELQARQDGVARAFELARPLHVPRADDDVVVAELDGGHARERRAHGDGPGKLGSLGGSRLPPDDLGEHRRREALQGLHDPSMISPGRPGFGRRGLRRNPQIERRPFPLD